MRIAICDDEQYFCDQLKDLLKKVSKQLAVKFEIEVFHEGETLFERLRHGKRFQIIFMDIILSGDKGTDIAVRIREQLHDQHTQIVFISSSHEYGPEAVDSVPIKYLLKPLNYDHVYGAIKKGFETIAHEKKRFVYKSGKQDKYVLLQDIIYFEARDKQIRMVTKQGEVTFYGTISSIEDNQLHGFVLIHRSYLVNFFNIDSYSHEEVVMCNGDPVRIGNTRRDEVATNILRLADEYSTDV